MEQYFDLLSQLLTLGLVQVDQRLADRLGTFGVGVRTLSVPLDGSVQLRPTSDRTASIGCWDTCISKPSAPCPLLESLSHVSGSCSPFPSSVRHWTCHRTIGAWLLLRRHYSRKPDNRQTGEKLLSLALSRDDRQW